MCEVGHAQRMLRHLQQRVGLCCFNTNTLTFQVTTLNNTHCYLPQEETNYEHSSAQSELL